MTTNKCNPLIILLFVFILILAFTEKGYSQISELKGLLLKDIIPITELPFEPPFTMIVDGALCTGCGDCEARCLFNAIEMKEDIAQISPQKCDGCGLCLSICQQDAISMEMEQV